MADNFNATAGDGSVVGASDKIGGVDYPRVKNTWGPDGTANDVDVASGMPFPVQLRASGGTELALATAAKQPALGTAGSASTDVITIQGIASGTVVPVSGTITAVTSITNAVVVKGGTASGSAVANAPVTVGGRGATALPTAVADGQVIDLLLDKFGRVVVRHFLRENQGIQKTTISNTSETTIVTADASNKLDIHRLIITNTSATAVNVTIKDSTAGTTRIIFAVPAGLSVGFSGSIPMIQSAAANNNWTATASGSVSSLEITAEYIKAGT